MTGQVPRKVPESLGDKSWQIFLLICSLLLPTGFVLPFLPPGWNQFPLTDDWTSIAYALALVGSYLVMLVSMSVHALGNRNFPWPERFFWVMMSGAGWGSVIYFWLHYHRHPEQKD